MEILLTFDSTHAAIESERILLQADLAVKVMNLPSSIRAGCGISLRIAPDDFLRATQLLGSVGPFGAYRRCVSRGASTYSPYSI